MNLSFRLSFGSTLKLAYQLNIQVVLYGNKFLYSKSVCYCFIKQEFHYQLPIITAYLLLNCCTTLNFTLSPIGSSSMYKEVEKSFK